MDKSNINTIKHALQAGNYAQAISLTKHCLANESEPASIDELYYMLTVAHRLQGQIPQAFDSVQLLIQRQPDYARAHQEKAYLHLAQQQTDHAISSFLTATRLNPALLSSWLQLKSLYQQRNEVPAVDYCVQQIRFLQGLPKAICGARDLMYEGKLFVADNVCRRYLQANKHDAEAMLLLAEIGVRLKVYHDAEFLLESCIELHPDFTKAKIEYIHLLSKLGKFAKAKDVAQTLLDEQTDNRHFLAAKAGAMVGIGETQEAIAIYQSILQQHPTLANIQLMAGHAYKAAGQLDNAINAYRLAYHHKPDSGDAYWSLANTKTYTFTPQELSDMQALAAEQKISTEDRIQCLFALGKAFEDRHEYDLSFDYYRMGNELKNTRSRYDKKALEEQIQQQQRVYSKTYFTTQNNGGCQAPDPIFIVGLPRAGSTLLEQILASHSQVDGTMELHNVLSLVSRLGGKKGQYPKIVESLSPDYFEKFGQQYLDETQYYRQGAPFFIDKMPNNFLHIGLIKRILPNAKIIDARREPMACCFSGYKQLFAEGQEFSYTLDNLGHYYQSYLQMMAHWDEVLPGFVLRVQHEELINDLESQVRRLLDFCGLPFEQSCIEFYKTKRNIKTPSSEQVRQPIYTSAMEQWKNYQSHLDALEHYFQA
ncbi:tetratricopeptide repeat-containing sulfotransferase family protein [Paraglaciecola sp.]|uniref:tetratricopeptide repeat-containing sulfotransferase family protein n=1 Tax=Paraglaciecola sp. TaxID=1920173 RepID=UPI00273D62E4|nr:tetratricopeptide repeat-containing sulfotransferase family protein [Paraglaciecola sp.]MDP5028896.1 sulfotransferase [Paraglaciecola sp.]